MPLKTPAGISKDVKATPTKNYVKSSRFSPRPPDIFKMARRKNKRLRASPLVNSNRKHVVSSLSASKEEVTTHNIQKTGARGTRQSASKEEATTHKVQKTSARDTQQIRVGQRVEEVDTLVDAMNATLLQGESALKATSPRPLNVKKRKTAKSPIRYGETMIEGDELELVLHSDKRSFTIL